MRDYEKLVKALRQCGTGDFPSCATCGVDNVTCGEIKRLRMRRAADAIEELQAQINGWIEMERKALIKSVLKWINVKERLPEKSGLYLTYHAKRGSMTMHYSANNKAWNAFDHENEPKYALEVTHWMPISEPPEVMEND